ncbi:MAG: hypothetical protein ACKO90_34810, partial [Microcystis panniformis]
MCLNLNLESSASPLSNNSALTTAGFGFSRTITWKAIDSTATVAARDNTGTNPSSGTGVPIYLIDGNRVANNNADLWDGSIQTQINRTQTDGTYSNNVFTGSDTNGSAATNSLGGSASRIGN